MQRKKQNKKFDRLNCTLDLPSGTVQHNADEATYDCCHQRIISVVLLLSLGTGRESTCTRLNVSQYSLASQTSITALVR